MSQTEIGFIGIAVMIILLAAGVHVGLSLVIVGFAPGFAAIGGLNAALNNVSMVTFEKLNNYLFAVLPLFLLMSAFVSEGGIGKEAYETRTRLGWDDLKAD